VNAHLRQSALALLLPSRMALSCTFRSANMTIEVNVMRLSRRHGLVRVFFRLVRPTTRDMGQFSAKALSRSCYCWRRAPSCTYRSEDMCIEARVMRLSRRQSPAACLWRLLRPTTCLLRLVGRGSPKPRGTTSPTTDGARLTRLLPECGRQIRRRASSKRIYFTTGITGCTGHRRAPELDSPFVVI